MIGPLDKVIRYALSSQPEIQTDLHQPHPTTPCAIQPKLEEYPQTPPEFPRTSVMARSFVSGFLSFARKIGWKSGLGKANPTRRSTMTIRSLWCNQPLKAKKSSPPVLLFRGAYCPPGVLSKSCVNYLLVRQTRDHKNAEGS